MSYGYYVGLAKRDTGKSFNLPFTLCPRSLIANYSLVYKHSFPIITIRIHKSKKTFCINFVN